MAGRQAVIAWVIWDMTLVLFILKLIFTKAKVAESPEVLFLKHGSQIAVMLS